MRFGLPRLPFAPGEDFGGQLIALPDGNRHRSRSLAADASARSRSRVNSAIWRRDGSAPICVAAEGSLSIWRGIVACRARGPERPNAVCYKGPP